MDGAPKEKKTRRKRRVPGTDKPPRKSFSLRLEEKTFDRMNNMLKVYTGSRNEYIAQLIEHDLQYRERIRPLKSPVRSGEDDGGSVVTP
jgi:hypothetical protein